MAEKLLVGAASFFEGVGQYSEDAEVPRVVGLAGQRDDLGRPPGGVQRPQAKGVDHVPKQVALSEGLFTHSCTLSRFGLGRGSTEGNVPDRLGDPVDTAFGSSVPLVLSRNEIVPAANGGGFRKGLCSQ